MEGQKVAGAENTSLEKPGSLSLDQSPLGQSLDPSSRSQEKDWCGGGKTEDEEKKVEFGWINLLEEKKFEFGQ